MTDDCRYLEFGDTIFSLEHIKYVKYYYEEGNKLYNKILEITYWDGDAIELTGIAGYNQKELNEVYKKIKDILLNNYGNYDYEDYLGT